MAQLKRLRSKGRHDQKHLMALLDEDYDYYDYTSSEDDGGSESCR